MPADDAAQAADPLQEAPEPSAEAPQAPRSSGAASKHAVTARTKARRRAIEILFEADQKGLLRPSRDGDHFRAADRLRDLALERAVHSANHTEAPAYAREILAGLADHLAEVDDAIEDYAQEWTLSRMPAVDRAIARVAVWEIVHNDDVDAPVAVDEAMTLARILSTDDSPRYLGGLLGRVADLADTLR